MNTHDFTEIILLSLALGADAFSVALASGRHGFTPGRAFRLGWHFGLFQFIMPVIGWLIGQAAVEVIGNYGGPAVFIILCGIGVKMVYEGSKKTKPQIPDVSKGWYLITLSVATSLDALGAGFGLGLLGFSILMPAIIIGITCLFMTVTGLYLGARLFDRLGHRALIPGGIILIGIGVKAVM